MLLHSKKVFNLLLQFSKDIYIEEQKICVRRTVQRIKNLNAENGAKTKVIVSTPKSSASIREIPILTEMVSYLEKFQSSEDTFILTGKQKMLEPRTVQWHFKNILKEAEISETNFHVLRHTFATKCIESGCDIKFVSEILGHASTRITYDKYVHLSFAHKLESIEKLDFNFFYSPSN